MLSAQNKEVMSLREDHDQLVEVKSEVQRLRGLEQTHKLSMDRVTELELIIAQLTTDLDREKLDRESALNAKELVERESELVRKVSVASLYSGFRQVRENGKKSGNLSGQGEYFLEESGKVRENEKLLPRDVRFSG